MIFLTSFTLRLYRASLNAEALSIPLFQRGSTEAAPGREKLEKGEEHVRFSSFREKDGKKVRATETSYFSSFRPFDDPEGKSFLSSSSSFCLSLSRARVCYCITPTDRADAERPPQRLTTDFFEMSGWKVQREEEGESVFGRRRKKPKAIQCFFVILPPSALSLSLCFRMPSVLLPIGSSVSSLARAGKKKSELGGKQSGEKKRRRNRTGEHEKKKEESMPSCPFFRFDLDLLSSQPVLSPTPHPTPPLFFFYSSLAAPRQRLSPAAGLLPASSRQPRRRRCCLRRPLRRDRRLRRRGGV